MTAKTKLKSKTASTEIKCAACGGTGFPKVSQPVKPGRRIYPPPCKRCLGKGRVVSA
jgi:DnaJ-class molecular chaperone